MSSKKVYARREVAKRIGIVGGAVMVPASFASALLPTPEQVAGPFHPIDEQSDTDLDLTVIKGHARPATGEMILVRGKVFDAKGHPLEDVLVDVWQANHFGRYRHPEDKNTAPLDPDFQGWGLVRTDPEGRYGIKTIMPGPYPLSFLGAEGWRCRHIHFKVSVQGSAPLITQMYFEGDPLIEQDLEIAKVPDDLRHLLVVKQKLDDVTGLPLYQFDIVLDFANS
jgi:protocatechuate 3,4-dioxygenase beta subunit